MASSAVPLADGFNPCLDARPVGQAGDRCVPTTVISSEESEVLICAPQIVRRHALANERPVPRQSTSMPIARLAHASDLPSLLALFAVSEVSRVAEPRERAAHIWKETLAQPNVHVFVSTELDRIAATCMLITAPNLLRSGRRHHSSRPTRSRARERRSSGRTLHTRGEVIAIMCLCRAVERTQGCTLSTKGWASRPASELPTLLSVHQTAVHKS